jgi:Holliday junction resolvase RusA-like endonuclease
MRPPLTFFVAGKPIPSPRPRGRINKSKFSGKLFTQTYVPHTADDWKNCVRNDAKKAWEKSEEGFIPRPWEGPLCVSLTFYFPRPKGHFRTNGELKPNAPKWAEATKDRDNLDKVILDALTNICIWRDDRQVCDGRIRKLYVHPGNLLSQGGQMGCLIEIEECEL